MIVNVVGAGLAGCEASYQLLSRGIHVNLFDIKPKNFTPAHSNPDYAELVCSNSLKNSDITNACGLLKEEMRILDSIIIRTAYNNKVPAGNALAVNRENFAKEITDILKSFKNLNIINEEITSILEGPTIIATGPLTTEKLSDNIAKFIGEDSLYFFDAAAPIISAESIDMTNAYFMSRYGKGDEDYLNCPMNKEEYLNFYKELINAKTVELKSFEKQNVFEGCMPIETMAKRGEDTMRFGPLKPVGLNNPVTGKKYYAVLQLRKENTEATMYNMVGFQTNLNFSEQKRVFSLIPALKNAEFLRYGVMHKNTFINSPKVLDCYYRAKKRPDLFFAGQITGVEGYVESAASGLTAAINMALLLNGRPLLKFPLTTALGALQNHISSETENYQPMNINFGIIRQPEINLTDKKDKKDKYEKKLMISQNAINEIINIKKELSNVRYN